MNSLPKELEDIIIDYRNNMEKNEKYDKCMKEITSVRLFFKFKFKEGTPLYPTGGHMYPEDGGKDYTNFDEMIQDYIKKPHFWIDESLELKIGFFITE